MSPTQLDPVTEQAEKMAEAFEEVYRLLADREYPRDWELPKKLLERLTRGNRPVEQPVPLAELEEWVQQGLPVKLPPKALDVAVKHALLLLRMACLDLRIRGLNPCS